MKTGAEDCFCFETRGANGITPDLWRSRPSYIQFLHLTNIFQCNMSIHSTLGKQRVH